MAEYIAERNAERAKTARLRALRLAKEAADKVVKPTAPTKSDGAQADGLSAVMLSWPQIEGAVMQSSMDANEEGFLNCARYGLMLAERIEDDATRANLIKLVRAWLTAAKEIEKAGSNVLVQISAQL